jgi:CheY-like chemotaxis protein
MDVLVDQQKKYLERRLKDIADLRLTLDSDDFSLAFKIGHQLKGNAQTFGYPEFSNIGIGIEKSAIDKDKLKLRKAIDELEEAVRITLNQEKNIYVIDDDEDLREIIRWILKNEGYNVFTYSDPRLALNEYHSMLHFPDLIILDFFMGKLNGDEFLLQKKFIDNELEKKCPVLIISASLGEVRKKVAPDLFKDTLEKPFNIDKLIVTVKALTTPIC